MEPVIIHRKRVFVGSLPPSVGKAELERIFEKYGTIKNIVIHEKPGQSRYAFIIYTDREEAMKALISEQALLIDGKKICVATGYSKVKQRPKSESLHRKRLLWLARQKHLLYALNRSMRHYTDSELENMSSRTDSIFDQQDSGLLSPASQESAILDSRLKKLNSSRVLSKRRSSRITRSKSTRHVDSEYENVSSHTGSLYDAQENVLSPASQDTGRESLIDEERENIKLTRSGKTVEKKLKAQHLNTEGNTLPPAYLLPEVVLSRLEVSNFIRDSVARARTSESDLATGKSTPTTSVQVSDAALNSGPNYPSWTKSAFPHWTQSFIKNTSHINSKQEESVSVSISPPLTSRDVDVSNEKLSESKPCDEKYVFKFSLPLYVAAPKKDIISSVDDESSGMKMKNEFELLTNRKSSNVQEPNTIVSSKSSTVSESWDDEVKNENIDVSSTIITKPDVFQSTTCSHMNNKGTCLSCRGKVKLMPGIQRELFTSSVGGVCVRSPLDKLKSPKKDVECDIGSSVSEKDMEKQKSDAETQTVECVIFPSFLTAGVSTEPSVKPVNDPSAGDSEETAASSGRFLSG